MTVEKARVAVLGPVAVSGAGGALDIRLGETAGALLVALALAGGEVRSTAGLADDIWGDDAPRNPRGALQTAVSRLRTHAGADLVRSVAGGYVLGTDAVDLRIARDLTRAALDLPMSDPRRTDLFDDALVLWRGEPGADLRRAPIARQLEAAAGALRAEAEAGRVQTLLALGRAREAAAAARELVIVRPHDQSAVGDLMAALTADGRPHEAIALYAEFRERLRDDLGVSPGAELEARHTALLQDPPVPAARIRIGVVTPTTTLLGRGADISAVGAALGRSSLVTVLGPGGLGKTRLALAVAATSEAPAVVFVPLAGIRSDGDVPLAIAAALGIPAPAPGRLTESPAAPDLRSRFIAHLGDRPTILVLDNCEQIIGGVAGWVADMLGTVPGLRVLATSRTPLSVAGEVVFPLDPLRAFENDEIGPAVRLFIERASALRPGATLPVDVIARICERLDGLPLAIELAAARVRTMSPAEIEDRLADRFALLTTGNRAAPARHRTLQAVIEWSWDLLDADARRALMRLACLPAGFTAGGAAAIVGQADADDVLDRLVAQSLVLVGDDPSGGPVRFRMLETIREFGLAKLERAGETADALAAVREWARDFALDHVADVQERDGFRALDAEHDNLVTVLRRALDDGDREEAAALFAVLGQVWILRGVFTDVGAFAAPIVELLVPRLEARATHAPSVLALLGTDRRTADALAVALLIGSAGAGDASPGRQLRVLGMLRTLARGDVLSPRWRAFVLIASASGSFAGVRATAERLSTSADPEQALVGAAVLAQVAENDGDVGVAYDAAIRARQLADRRGQDWFVAMTSNMLGELESQSARPAEALEWFDRADVASSDFGSVGPGRQSWALGSNLLAVGRVAEARALFTELGETGGSSDDGLPFSVISLFGLAEVERLTGDPGRAAGLYESALAGIRASNARRSPWFPVSMAALLAATVVDASLPSERLAWWARRLRTRVLAMRRVQPMYVDRPVLGATLTGWSAWALSVPDRQERGLELLALADGLGARQDLTSLVLAPHWERASGIVGAAAVEDARASARILSQTERTDRAYELLLAE